MKPPRERRRPLDGAVNPNAETASQQGPVSDDDAKRHERIAEAAYYRAERRGFREGSERDDWLEAEKDIDRQDRQRARPPRSQGQGSPRPEGAIDVSSPDHMVPRKPLPSGQPHDPLPGKEKARSKKPDRRARAR
jgi:hypothetical protein